MQRRRARRSPAVRLVTDRARTIMIEDKTQHRVDAVTNGACEQRHNPNRPRRLPLSVEMQSGETATSLCSRNSAANGLPRMRTKCTDFSISHVDLCNGEAEAVTRVADWPGPIRRRCSFTRRD